MARATSVQKKGDVLVSWRLEEFASELGPEKELQDILEMHPELVPRELLGLGSTYSDRATGFEPETPAHCKVSDTGHKLSSSGQNSTQPGQPQGDASRVPVELRTEAAHGLTHPGRARNTTGTQQEHNGILLEKVPSDLAKVVKAWRRLPKKVRKKILNIVERTLATQDSS